MTKSMQLENRLNELKTFTPAVWVFTKGHKFFIQSRETGNIFKEFSSFTEAESYVEKQEEKEMFENENLEVVEM